jgi:hypothetical protein
MEDFMDIMNIAVNVKEDDVMQINEVFLVEWQEAPPVRQIVAVDDKPFEAFGLKPNRIIDINHNVVCQYNADEDTISFAPLEKKEGSFLVSVSAPSSEVADFHWYCQRLGAFIDDKNIHLVFGRICTDEESEYLNNMFPEWLNQLRKLGVGE